MSTHATYLTPSLHPSSLLSISLPTILPSSSNLSEKSIVRQYEVVAPEGMEALGGVQRMCLARGGGEGGEDNLIVADSNHRISLTTIPKASSSSHKLEDDDDDDDDGADDEEDEDEPDLIIKQQYKVASRRKGDVFVGLGVASDHILSTLSSGHLSLHPLSSSSTRTNSPSPTPQTLTTTLPSPLTCARLISPNHLVVAGKDVDVSVWDVERTFARASGSAGTGGKRKKNEMEEGEGWRAKNLPNNHLNLQTPIHHLSLTLLPPHPSPSTSTSSEAPTSIPTTHIVTGTKSGHVRRYDTRQRKPVGNWKVAREGGVGSVAAGVNEHELFFADTSSLFGSLDLRTGRVLYAYAQQTSTAQHILPLDYSSSSSSYTSKTLSASDLASRIGLVTLSSDATLRACSTTPPPANVKHNVSKGQILGGIGGVGLGGVIFTGFVERDEDTEESGAGEDGDEDEGIDGEAGEDVWDDLEVVEGEGSEGEGGSDSDSDEESEDEVVEKGRRNGKNSNKKRKTR